MLRMSGERPGIDAEFTARFRFPIVTRWRMQWRRKFVDRIDGQMRRFPPFHHFRVGTKFCKLNEKNSKIILFDFSRETSCSIPVRDRQIALQLLLELSVQRASLRYVLMSVHLLLELWDVEESGQVISTIYSSSFFFSFYSFS